jgi:lambda repressor-like predicted transcriptional regulator
MENEHLRCQIRRVLKFSGWSSRKLSLESGLQKGRVAMNLRSTIRS